MSLMTTWTSTAVPHRPASETSSSYDALHPAWDCANCDLLNPGVRRRCTDCGTRRD